MSRRNADREWPPVEKALTLDCVIMRMIPDSDGKGGSCAVLRIYGRNPLLHLAKSLTLLFSTPRKHKNIPYYYQVRFSIAMPLFVFILMFINLKGLSGPGLDLHHVNVDTTYIFSIVSFRSFGNSLLCTS